MPFMQGVSADRQILAPRVSLRSEPPSHSSSTRWAIANAVFAAGTPA